MLSWPLSSDFHLDENKDLLATQNSNHALTEGGVRQYSVEYESTTHKHLHYLPREHQNNPAMQKKKPLLCSGTVQSCGEHVLYHVSLNTKIERTGQDGFLVVVDFPSKDPPFASPTPTEFHGVSRRYWALLLWHDYQYLTQNDGEGILKIFHQCPTQQPINLPLLCILEYSIYGVHG